jgi:hypothetical protein
LTFDLEELNCWNKDLDVGLDALGHNLNLFLHKTYMLAEFMCHLRKIISLKFGRLIGLQVRNPTKLSLHQMDFCSSRYSSRNGWRSTLAKYEIWLWRLRFPFSFFFYFSCHICIEIYGCYLSNATGITSFRCLELKLYTKHRVEVNSTNYFQFTSFWILHPKVPSKHKTKNINALYI